ncbi:MAG TPA: methylated-DNA--[protein]-cysteine S-methyltransferase, partial [Chloroflexia bacterium]|nr:methylated-DNA--[protein]-cysteine S-methyltransferase [Chloroflexia bacterium]
MLLTSDGASLTGLYMVTHQYGPEVEESWMRRDDAPPFEEAKRQLSEYFSGTLTRFDLPLAPQGTQFQGRVWEELQKIPYGTTISYGELARRIGNANASRAVGLANGRNPISIIVPCHRVIGANGKLTGYGGGLPRKQARLAFEATVFTNGPC